MSPTVCALPISCESNIHNGSEYLTNILPWKGGTPITSGHFQIIKGYVSSKDIIFNFGLPVERGEFDTYNNLQPVQFSHEVYYPESSFCQNPSFFSTFSKFIMAL